MSTYKGKPLGTFGEFGCLSFHETKNYSMGEGGAILIRDSEYIEPAEIIREKGTDRSKFFRGQVDKYTWVNFGSNQSRIDIWNRYYENLKPLADKGMIELPVVPDGCVHNGHMFYIKAKDIHVRTKLIDYLKENGILSVFHYIPLHTATAGKKFGRFHGTDQYTTKESERLTRLPLYYGLSLEQTDDISNKIIEFYETRA